MYTQSITRSHRTAFILAIDQSGSMAEKLLFRGRQTTKAEAVAEVTNRPAAVRTHRTGPAQRRGARLLRHRGIGLFGRRNRIAAERSGAAGSGIAAGRSARRFRRNGRGAPHAGRRSHLPQDFDAGLIAPKAVGKTPMYEALLQIRDLTQAWCTNPAHSESFPPIVFNITDGEASDCDQREQAFAICEKIRTIGTTDGKVLLINIHIATTSDSTFAALSDRRGDSRRQPLRKTAARLFESDARRKFQRRSDRCGAIWPNHPSGE